MAAAVSAERPRTGTPTGTVASLAGTGPPSVIPYRSPRRAALNEAGAAGRVVGVPVEDLPQRHLAVQLGVEGDEDGAHHG